MIGQRRSVITYDGLPVSSGGAHKLKMRGPRAAWSATETFLKNCTDYNSPSSLFVELLEEKKISDSFSKSFKRRFSKQFGTPRTRKLGHATGLQWDVSKEMLTNLVDLLETSQPFPEYPLCPLTINLSADFRLVNPKTRSVLAHQDRAEYLNFEAGYHLFLGLSTLYAILSSKSTVSVFFSLPYEDVTKELRGFVQFLQEHLPFRFSAKHWKIWKVNQAGTGYVGRKISNIVA